MFVGNQLPKIFREKGFEAVKPTQDNFQRRGFCNPQCSLGVGFNGSGFFSLFGLGKF